MRKFCLPAILFLFYHVSNGQQLYFNHLSVNNGLTQGVNNCIFKDSKGFVWVSSFDGLNRFDGIDCKKYYASTNQQEGIRGTLFLNVLEDRNSNLWIGSNAGLNFYDREKDVFFCYRIGTGNGEQFCSPFYIDHQNRIWLQSRSAIYVFDPANNRFISIGGPVSNGNFIIKTMPIEPYQRLEKIVLVSNNSVDFWKGNVHDLAVAWQKETLPLKAVTINAMILTGPSACVVGTGDGIYRFVVDSAYATFEKITSRHLIVSALHLDKTNTLWIGTADEGLLKSTIDGEIIQQYNSSAENSYSISGNQVIYIYTDDDRNLWVSVWGKGVDYTNLDKFNFNQFISKSAAAAAGTDNFIRSIAGVGNETWCAAQSGGIIVLDTLKKIKQVLQTGFAIEHLLATAGNVWAATFRGLFSIDPLSKRVEKIRFEGIAEDYGTTAQYNYVSPLNDGLLLSSNAGIYMVKPGKAGFKRTPLKGIEAADVYLTSYQDTEGRLFISRAFKGFGVYTLQQDSLQLIKLFPIQATIKCFEDTPDSLLWMGSTVGLIRFNKKLLQVSKIYTTENGLSNQYVYGVVNDGRYLWLSTNAGINRFDPSTGQVKIFSVADGLQSNEYNTYSFYRTKAGEILFGGVNGLNGFNPNQLKPFTTAPRLVLSRLHLNDTLYTPAVNYSELDALEVAYKQNTLSFQFTVIDYANAAAAHISYMLEGYDRGWVNAANKTLIRYANLPPGTYVLKVRAFNADGVMAEKIYQLLVTVQAPWWQSWWFRVLMLIVLAVIIRTTVRMYLRRKLQKQRVAMEKELAIEQERNRMARELHDGMGSMLSGIKHSFSAIKKELPLNETQQTGFDNNIEKLNASIHELRNISHSMASASLLQDGLASILKDLCGSMSQPGILKISFEDMHTSGLQLKEEQSFHVLRIVQELLHNIIRHAGATEAIVQLSANNQILYITVEDNGRGFSNESTAVKSGLGLKNIDSRVKILKGKMDIRSQSNQGTSILIEMPVGG